MEPLHHLNIIVHVIAGSLGLIAGMAAIIAGKTSTWHRRLGRVFMWLIVIIIITGIAGVLVFKRNTFLLVLTLLSGYNCFSGIRAIKLQGKRPRILDIIVPLVVMSSAIYYLWYTRSIGLYWAPVIIYSTIGALFLLTLYDLCKTILPLPFLQKAVLYEHAYKMMGAFSGITSAFSGTVFPQYKPYSQFLPSVLGFAFIIVTFIWLSRKPFPIKRQTCTG